MMDRILALTVFLFLAAVPQATIAQDSIGPEDVEQCLKDPGFQASLGSCFTTSDRPEAVTLVLHVKAQGETLLAHIQDEVPEATSSCISSAVSHLTMPATGSQFQITVTVPVPAPAPKVGVTIKQVEAAPSPPPVAAPPLVAPAAIPLVAAPAVPVVAHPVASKPAPPPGPPPEWKIRYSKGKKRYIGGLVALGVGLQFALVGGLGFLGTMHLMCDSSRYYTDESFCRLWVAAGITFLVIGAAGTITGAILAAQGKRIKQEALESKPQLAIAPLPRGDGVMAGLVWRL